MNQELLISAKPSRRLFAFLFDLILNSLISTIILIPAILAFVDIYNNPTNQFKLWALFISSIASGALSICFIIFYFVYLPVIWEGQTIGKRILKIRIIDISTNEGPNAKTMFIRETFRIVILVLTFGLSTIASFFALCLSNKHTTFHEQLSSTRVVNVNIYSQEKKIVDIDN